MRSPRCKTWLTFFVCSWKAVCKPSPHPALKQEIESSRMTVFTISSAGAGSLWDGRYLVNRTFFSLPGGREDSPSGAIDPSCFHSTQVLSFLHSAYDQSIISWTFAASMWDRVSFSTVLPDPAPKRPPVKMLVPLPTWPGYCTWRWS